MLASNGIPCLHSEVLLYSYLGVTQCTENIFRTKVEPMKENVAEKEKLNWRLDQIIKGGAGIGVAYLLFGLGLSSYWITRCGSDFGYNTVYFFLRTMNTVRRLVLRKGGKNITIQTYGFTGMDNWCIINSESTKFKN